MDDKKEKILSEWVSLDSEHKKFILRVRNGNGAKRSAEPHYCYYAGETPQIALWHKAEESGFIECVGSFKWVVTKKFNYLESVLFGVYENPSEPGKE